MNATEKKYFATIWGHACEVQAGKIPSDDAMKMAAGVLSAYEISEIRIALSAYLKQSRFVPTPSDIVKLIEGELPADETLVALAGEPETMLGAIVSRNLTAHDFASLSPQRLKAKAKGNRGKYEDFRKRALVGELTDNEIRMFNGKGLSVVDEISSGVPGCRAPFRAALQQRAVDLKVVAIGHDKSDPEEGIASPEFAKDAMAQLNQALRGMTQ